MSISTNKKVPIKLLKRKVVILLRDHDASAKVYVEILGKLNPSEVMVQALRRLEDGLIYADAECTMLIESDYIEVYRKRNMNRRVEEDFIFLIDRAYAVNYVVSAEIIKK